MVMPLCMKVYQRVASLHIPYQLGKGLSSQWPSEVRYRDNTFSQHTLESAWDQLGRWRRRIQPDDRRSCVMLLAQMQVGHGNIDNVVHCQPVMQLGAIFTQPEDGFASGGGRNWHIMVIRHQNIIELNLAR